MPEIGPNGNHRPESPNFWNDSIAVCGITLDPSPPQNSQMGHCKGTSFYRTGRISTCTTVPRPIGSAAPFSLSRRIARLQDRFRNLSAKFALIACGAALLQCSAVRPVRRTQRLVQQ